MRRVPFSISAFTAMARHEADREDLIREATGLRDRVEWRIPGEPEPVLTGIKRNGALSIYFGQDPVYQFDADGRLRRAFVDGCLYRTQGTTLARLHRERSDTETVLARYDLSTDELAGFITTMRDRLRHLHALLSDGSASRLREVHPVQEAASPHGPDFIELIAQCLRTHPVLAPAIATRRN